MENQLPTQNQFNEQKEKILQSIKDNLYYIYVVLMFLVNFVVSCCEIKDGTIKFLFPKTALAWCMWLLQILIATTIGVMILYAFRKQGLRNGHKRIKETYDKYIKALSKPNKKFKPRSEKEYLAKEGIKDSASKFIMFFIVGSFAGSITIGWNLNNLMSLMVTTLMSIGFGIVTMLNAEEYVVTELVIWYNNKIEELEEENGKRNMLGTRQTKSNTIQQGKKRIARQTNKEPEPKNKSDN